MSDAIDIAIIELEAVEREIGVPSKALPLLRSLRAPDEPSAIPDAARKLGELASAHVVMRLALQKIISDGDFTAPEGMKRIARAALETTASAAALARAAEPPAAAQECSRCHCMERMQKVLGDLRMSVAGGTGIPFAHWSKDPLIPYKDCHCSSCNDARNFVANSTTTDGTAETKSAGDPQ